MDTLNNGNVIRNNNFSVDNLFSRTIMEIKTFACKRCSYISSIQIKKKSIKVFSCRCVAT